MWGLYGGLLRADFGLFDTYAFDGADGAEGSMGAAVTVFYASNDKKITEAHVRGWARFGGRGAFTVERIEGNHMFVSNQDQKAAWFKVGLSFHCRRFTVIVSPCRHFTVSSFHCVVVSLSSFHRVVVSPCHRFTVSSFHRVVVSLCRRLSPLVEPLYPPY
jgi:hypothetical protein